MEFLQPIFNCLNNLCSCCLNCTEDLASQQGLEPNERTHLLVDPVNNNSPLRRNNSDNFSNEYAQSLPKKDEQTALNRLVQNTATDMIDVGAMDSHLESKEYNDRAKLYLQRLQQQWSNIQIPTNAPTGLLKDIPNPELYLTATPISAPDLSLIKNAITKAQAAVDDIKVDHKEDIVVPFRIPS